jgi:octaprenyl-diphosphate synthase
MGYSGKHLIPIAAVCEYVHSASLLHDDVIDNSSLRRNKPTANRIWGDEASVLVGDLVYSRASEMMAESGSLELVKTFAKAIRLMSEGELLQLENVFNMDIAEETYLRIVENKTAVLISACCRAAGLLAEAEDKTVDLLATYGRSVGMAFQLVDDALDYTVSEERMGKPTGHDLIEGKITMPVIKLREKASTDEWQQVMQFSKSEFSQQGIDYVRSLVDKYQTVSQTLDRARELSDTAIAALDGLPESDLKESLKSLTSYLLWRQV